MIYKDCAQEKYFVYILLCSDDSFYVGLTNELERRYEDHQNGVYENCYTFSRRPLYLKYFEIIPFLEEAERREIQLKKWSQAKKKALIEQNFHKLQLLSQCQNFSHHKYKNLR